MAKWKTLTITGSNSPVDVNMDTICYMVRDGQHTNIYFADDRLLTFISVDQTPKTIHDGQAVQDN